MVVSRMPETNDPTAPPVRSLRAADEVELAFDLAPVGLCVSRDRIIQRCNEAFGAMFGDAPARLEGLSLECMYPSRAEFEHIGAQGLPVMQRTGHYSDERIMRHRSGRLFWCHVAGRALEVSPCTIDGHRARIMKKVGAHSASEMISRLVGLR
jgi:PAS domain S-box-containing protein